MLIENFTSSLEVNYPFWPSAAENQFHSQVILVKIASSTTRASATPLPIQTTVIHGNGCDNRLVHSSEILVHQSKKRNAPAANPERCPIKLIPGAKE